MLALNGVVTHSQLASAADWYAAMGYSYPKFYKMDVLCQWAWLAAETLLAQGGDAVYEGLDKEKIAVVLQTHDGCLEVDKKYLATLDAIPSPALFVYTLPNIMLGEVCIRHGFKGEQLCMAEGAANMTELYFAVRNLLQAPYTQACLCGWINATGAEVDICLYWVTKAGNGIEFYIDNIQQFYNNIAINAK